METGNCSYEIPENADNIIFAENFVNYFMSLYGFELPLLRIPTQFKGVIYDAFNELVQVTAHFIFYRISVFNTYATFQKLNIVNKYTYLLFASKMERRYFSNGFLLSHFLHYCCQLTYMAVSFYMKKVHEAPIFAVSCIVEKLEGYNMLVSGGWRALNIAASRYVSFIQECNYLSLSNCKNLKSMLQEMELGDIYGPLNLCKSNRTAEEEFCKTTKENDDDFVQSFESGMTNSTVSSDADSFVQISLDDFETLQVQEGNKDREAIESNEFDERMPVEGIDKAVPSVEKKPVFTDEVDSAQADKSKTTKPTQASTQTPSFTNENCETKQSMEYKSNAISDENYLLDGCKQKVKGNFNSVEKSDSPNSNKSVTSTIAINSDDCLQVVASNADSVKRNDLRTKESETSMDVTNSVEESLLDGTRQSVVKNMNFIEEFGDFVRFWQQEDITNATYDWETELLHPLDLCTIFNKCESQEFDKNGDGSKAKFPKGKSRKSKARK